jgi:colanic acid biosynthesis glycosyl transferase WcaI
MRIRFFNTYEPVTTFYRDLLPFLAESNIKTDVIISAAEYRSSRSPLRESFQDPNIRVVHLPSMGILPKGRLQKAWLIVAYMFSAAFISLFSPSVDLNFFLTQPPFFALWGWVLKVLRGQRYMCLLMDIYPDVAIQDGLLQPGSLVVRLLSALKSFILKRADAVIVIGRCMRDQLLRAGVSDEKMHLIPNWVNEKMVYPVLPEQNSLRDEYGLKGSFVVLYSGNLGISHEFQTLIDAAECLLPEKAIRFVIIGGGSRRPALEKQVRLKRLENILFLPFQPFKRLAESLSLGDVHLVTLRTGFEGLVVPSKAYSAQAAGRPLIYVGERYGEIARMVSEEEIGFVVAPGDGVALADAISKYFNDKSLYEIHAQNAFILSQGRYSSLAALSSYLKLFMKVQNAST